MIDQYANMLAADLEIIIVALQRIRLLILPPEATPAMRRDSSAPLAESPPELKTAHPVNVANLTTRELEIAQLFSTGENVKGIAKKLGVNPKTISRHRTTIYRKLGVRKVAQVARALEKAGTA